MFRWPSSQTPMSGACYAHQNTPRTVEFGALGLANPRALHGQTDRQTHAVTDKCKRFFRPNVKFTEVKADRPPYQFHFQFLIKKELGS